MPISRVVGPPGDSESAGVGAWKVVAASVAGKAHVAREQGNEDAVHTARLADGTLLLALADGAGSAARASEGSRLAVEMALESLRRSLGGEPSGAQAGRAVDLGVALRAAFGEVRSAVAATLRRSRGTERKRARDLASTLLLAVLTEETLGVLQVGDGAAVAGDGSGWRRLTEPLRGPHAGETVFATSRGAARHVEVAVEPLGATVALGLLSDGLEPVATDLSTGEPHAPFFDPLVPFVLRSADRQQREAELARFLRSERVQARSPDDLSLVLAVRCLE